MGGSEKALQVNTFEFQSPVKDEKRQMVHPIAAGFGYKRTDSPVKKGRSEKSQVSKVRMNSSIFTCRRATGS
jgi:hypothetical protein